MREAMVFCGLNLIVMVFLLPFSRDMKGDPFPNVTVACQFGFCLSFIAMPFLLGWFILDAAYAP